MSTYNKAKPGTTIVLTRKVPKDIHQAFKAICAIEGVTLQQAIIDLMTQCVEDKAARDRKFHKHWKALQTMTDAQRLKQEKVIHNARKKAVLKTK